MIGLGPDKLKIGGSSPSGSTKERLTMNVLQDLASRGLLTIPKWIPDNIQYLSIHGSVAYGVSGDASDTDIYGVVIPPKEFLFPHLLGEINGFGRLATAGGRWRVLQAHHINDEEKGKKYDFQIYNIVDFFQLVMDGNPNMIDSVFTPEHCVLSCTQVGSLIRENRRMFLTKKCWHTYKGYAYAQVKKMQSQTRVGKRAETVAQYGFDVKFAYHVVRLLNQVEQILVEGDLDLTRNSEQLESIRRGEWSKEQILEYFSSKERELETAYTNSRLPYGPEDGGLQDKVKDLLFQCLEAHYGSLSAVVNRSQSKLVSKMSRIRDILDEP